MDKTMVKQPLVDMVIFGGSGSLAFNKIMPALYYLFLKNYIDGNSRIFSTSRKNVVNKNHRQQVYGELTKHVSKKHYSTTNWQSFAARLFCINMDITNVNNYTELTKQLNKHKDRERVYYLSTPSLIFGDICIALNKNGLISKASRIVLEKPIGHSLESFKKIDNLVRAVFPEHHIFRIDHYLGKDTVQNILALRFSNALFMPIWNQQYIDHVQITVSEKIGVGKRWSYYDKYGAMRDMVQNHLLQLLCLIAMEPPVNLSSDSIHDEKVKVLKALRNIKKQDIATKTVRGQYQQGYIDNTLVSAYCKDDYKSHPSNTETFVAIRADIDNWTWQGVPFYLRTGKRMSAQFSEIIIQFKKTPHTIFTGGRKAIEPNKLVINLQPEESVKLLLMHKTPSLNREMTLHSVELELNKAYNNSHSPSAYERLLLDIIYDDLTLFMRRDEVEAAWIWTDSILDTWIKEQVKVKAYKAGYDGPDASFKLIEQDSRSWYKH